MKKALIISLFLLPAMTLAVSPSAINVSVYPPNPAPYENVTITLSSYAANLDAVNIQWLVGGKTTSSGIGKKTFQVTVGAAGTETRVIAKIMLPDGEIDKNIILRPATLALFYEATDSYVPPFYRGKALPTEGSEIKIVALPEIRVGSSITNPKNLTYQWKRGYQNLTQGSGYGKNFLVYASDYLDSVSEISVVASTIDGKYSSGGSINIGSYDPAISFYRKDPALGVLWERALSSPYRISGEETLVAEPYYISPGDIRRPELVFKWFINNFQIPTQIFTKNILPVRAEAGASGTSNVRLEIENTDKIYSTASGEINIQF